MTDEEIQNVIQTMDLMAKDALKLAKDSMNSKRDAEALANLIYDVYRDNNGINNHSETNI